MLLNVTTKERQTLAYSDRGKGTPLFFFPGGGTSTTFYETFLEKLEADFRVIAINYPGFDKAPASQAILSIDYYARCFAAAIQSFGFKKNFVVTHSMGSGVTLTIAQQNPGLLSKVALMAPMLRQFPGTQQELATRVALNAAQSKKKDEMLKKKEIIPFIKKNAHNAQEIIKQLDMTTKRYTVPLSFPKDIEKLVFLGEKDVIFPYKEEITLLEKVNKKTVVSYHDAGHDLMFTHTEQIVTSISDFFTHKV